MSENIIAARILLSFIAALSIIYITAKLLGNRRKASWFKKREKSNIFTRRGFLGESCNFGVPRSWQGIAISLWLISSIGIISYFIIFYSY